VAGFDPVMPTFAGQVSEEQLTQLIAYVRSLGAGSDAALVAGAAGTGGTASTAGTNAAATAPGGTTGPSTQPNAGSTPQK
jgi:hypothetical protein